MVGVGRDRLLVAAWIGSPRQADVADRAPEDRRRVAQRIGRAGGPPQNVVAVGSRLLSQVGRRVAAAAGHEVGIALLREPAVGVVDLVADHVLVVDARRPGLDQAAPAVVEGARGQGVEDVDPLDLVHLDADARTRARQGVAGVGSPLAGVVTGEDDAGYPTQRIVLIRRLLAVGVGAGDRPEPESSPVVGP